MSTVNEKKTEKYHRLITAAFDLFEVKGITGVSIDEIVKKAGVAKGTFYLYFKDKVDLVSKLIFKKAAEDMKMKEEIPDIESDEDFNTCVKKYIDFLALFLQRNKTLTALIDKNIYVCVNAIEGNNEGAVKSIHDNIVKYFTGRGVPEGEVKIKIYICLEMTISLCCNAILRGKPYSLDDIKPYLYDMVTASLNTHKLKEATL